MEVLKFVFQNFWVWLGTTILCTSVISAIFEGFAKILRSFTGKYPPVVIAAKKEEE